MRCDRCLEEIDNPYGTITSLDKSIDICMNLCQVCALKMHKEFEKRNER